MIDIIEVHKVTSVLVVSVLNIRFKNLHFDANHFPDKSVVYTLNSMTREQHSRVIEYARGFVDGYEIGIAT